MQHKLTDKTKKGGLPLSPLLNALTLLGTGLLRAIDAFWAAVAAITTPGRRGESRGLADNAKQQPLAGFPNFAPAHLAEDERIPNNA